MVFDQYEQSQSNRIFISFTHNFGFVKPQRESYAMMAVTMVTIDLIVMAGYTGLAAKVLKLLKSPRQQKYLNRTFCSVVQLLWDVCGVWCINNFV